MKSKNFLKVKNHTKEELEQLVEFAFEQKTERSRRKALTGVQLGLLFNSASTRTRVSFQAAARQLGAEAEYLNMRDLQIQNSESLIDTAIVLSQYLDGLIIRNYDMDKYGQGQADLEAMAERVDIPVINAYNDTEHPCQIMADVLTLRELYGEDFRNKRIVFTWGYAVRQKAPGVTNSMVAAAGLLGMNMVLTYPKGFGLDEEYDEFTQNHSSGSVEISHDLMESCENADAIYMRSWKSPLLTAEEDRKIREEVKGDWCVTSSHFARANPNAVFMDCMPLIRGEGVTADVVDGPHSIIYKQAANRLHIQKALLLQMI